jgi:hypothetical protein
MKREEIKKLIIGSLDADADPSPAARQLDDEVLSLDFRKDFTGKVIDKLFTAGITVNRQMEFVRNLNTVFYRIALTGVAAIVILLISIYLAEGSFSLNSFLGIGNTSDESIVCLLTGN